MTENAEITFPTCLHCQAKLSPSAEAPDRVGCDRCGWFNELAFDELDEVPLRILPADLPQKWASTYQWQEDLHVAYVPFTTADVKTLPEADQDRFLALWEKVELDETDRALIARVRRSGSPILTPLLTLKGQKIDTTQSARGQGIKISTAYVRDGVLSPNTPYGVVFRNEQTLAEIRQGSLILKGYPDADPRKYTFRLRKQVDPAATYVVDLYLPE
jgi:hypothetical protein